MHDKHLINNWYYIIILSLILQTWELRPAEVYVKKYIFWDFLAVQWLGLGILTS